MMKSDNITNQFPSTPPPSSPPFSAPTTQTSPGDECFRCKKLGHWAKQCPEKTPPLSPSSSPGSAGNISDLPLVRCPCDRGACRILTSRTTKNPDRKFYTCPVEESRGKCRFFKWCSELSDRVPDCPCGVGKCSLNRYSSGPDEGKWYYSCRIKKNFGRCDFFQWADPEINSMMKRYEGQSNRHSSPQVLFNTANARHSGQDPVPNMDLVAMQEVETSKPLKRKAPEGFQSMAQLENHCLGKVWGKVSNVRDFITEDVMLHILGIHAHGWLGRLAFPPSRCPKDPPVVAMLCCVFPSFDPVITTEDVDTPDVEGSHLLPHATLSAETENLQSQTPVQDAQVLDSALHEPLGLKDPSVIIQDDFVLSKSILRKLGQSLLNIIESMRPLDPEKMLKVAEAFFIPLKNLSIECDPFVEAVKNYIHNLSKVASIEGSMRTRLSYRELSNLHENEKVRSDNISRLHNKALAEYRASNNRFHSLQEEVLHIRGLLVELEKQLFCCEAENSALKARVDELSVDLLESNKNVEAVALDMSEALELERQQESFSNAARAAFETANSYLE